MGQNAISPGYQLSGSIIWAWIGVAAFALAMAAFLIMGLRASEDSKTHFVQKFFIVMVAATSYLALAMEQGAQKAGEQGAEFTYARYIDWAITTPLLLLGLATLALPIARNWLGLVLGIMGADLYMIVTGLFAGLSNDNSFAKWIWFIVSSAAFVALYVLIWDPLRNKAQMQREDLPRRRPGHRPPRGEGQGGGPARAARGANGQCDRAGDREGARDDRRRRGFLGRRDGLRGGPAGGPRGQRRRRVGARPAEVVGTAFGPTLDEGDRRDGVPDLPGPRRKERDGQSSGSPRAAPMVRVVRSGRRAPPGTDPRGETAVPPGNTRTPRPVRGRERGEDGQRDRRRGAAQGERECITRR